MKFGLVAWKQTPLAVKLGYLEAQKALAEAESVNHQLREQRDRLRGVSRQCVRYGLKRADATLAFVGQEERRLVARCAKLKRAHRNERLQAETWQKLAREKDQDFRDCNEDRTEAILILEQVVKERSKLRAVLAEGLELWDGEPKPGLRSAWFDFWQKIRVGCVEEER